MASWVLRDEAWSMKPRFDWQSFELTLTIFDLVLACFHLRSYSSSHFPCVFCWLQGQNILKRTVYVGGLDDQVETPCCQSAWHRWTERFWRKPSFDLGS